MNKHEIEFFEELLTNSGIKFTKEDGLYSINYGCVQDKIQTKGFKLLKAIHDLMESDVAKACLK